MDLRQITGRIPRETANNAIYTFEKGDVVRRTFAQVHEDIAAARGKLESWGVKPGMRVGIRSPNCYGWIIHDLALIDLRAVTVAFTDDFASFTAEELSEKYGLSLFLQGFAQREMKAVDRGFADDDPELERPGLIFSSGSAGGIKGLTLNRRGVEASIDAFTRAVGPRHDDRLLLFLPMSNFQQRLMYYAALWYGFDLIVTEPVHLFRGLGELSPTILIAPPALYEAFETRFDHLPRAKKLAAKIGGTIARALPVRAWREKLARTLFKQAYEALGGRMRLMVTGMAPIKRTTLQLFDLMQLPLFETYGLIESGSVALNLPDAKRVGSVGKLLPGVSVTFGDDGEIIVHRENPIAVGYFECAPGESEKTFVGGGAVATGDIGRLDRDGYLYLVGRKKEIIVTGGGEKVHPEVIEAELNACPDIDRAVVCAEDGAPALAAIVRPKQPDDPAAQARIHRFIEDQNDRWSKVSVGKVVFTDVVFTRENGLLRPNLKLDRRRISEHFRQQLEA